MTGRFNLNFGGVSELVEGAGSSSKMKGLSDRLGMIQKATLQDLLVQISVPREVKYQRYVDVLNCLAGEGISHVSLTDHVDE